MRIRFMVAAAFVLASADSAAAPDRPTAILVSPIHEAQVVRGDDGKDHVEYDLLVVSVVADPVTLSSVTVLDPAGTELMRIDGDALAAATQNLFPHTPTTVIPSSGAVAVEVDLVLAPGTVPATGHQPDRLQLPQGAASACSRCIEGRRWTHQTSRSTADPPS